MNNLDQTKPVIMKKIIWIVLILSVVGILGYLYVFHKPHRDVQGEKAKYSIQAGELTNAYQSDMTAANELYLDQVVQVNGKVSELEENAITLEGGVYATFLPEDFVEANIGDQVAIKGRVVSYDELFEQVRLDNCSKAQ